MKRIITTYSLLLLNLSVFSYSFVDINLIYLKPLYTGLYLNNRFELSAIYIVILICLFILSFFIFKNSDKFKNKDKIIFLFVLITILSYPAALSFDIFNYITTAKVAFYYHENPYVIYPYQFINEPYLQFTRATNKLALYAPFWILLTAVPYYLGFGNFILTLLSFKLLVAIFYLATIFIMRKMDEEAWVFFAFNPLVIIETLISSHNDIVMVFFALTAIYLLKTDKKSSVLSLAASILIKYSTIFLLPIYILALFKKIKYERVFVFAAFSMFLIFLLSPIREEIYPWYAIWFIAFTSFLTKKKELQNLVLVFSFGLMLRYVPYMATGNYFGYTPIIKIILTILPPAIYLLYLLITKKIKFLK